MCNDAVNVKGIQPYVKTSIQNYEKDFHSPISVIDESIFILLQMFPSFLVLLSKGNITLCENKVKASKVMKKVSILLVLLLMKVTV